ncbi:MAG TPA: hypothetical protein VFZ09_46920, partial [Archangium sp.]|nr:hypothetical protein [Archangium sp.]
MMCTLWVMPLRTQTQGPVNPWARLLLTLALLCNACASLPPRGQGTHLRYTPHETAAPSWAQGPGEPPTPEPEGTQRLHRRQQARQAVTAVGPGDADTPARGSALAAHLALLEAVDEVSASTRRLSRELPRLRASHQGIARAGNGIFVRYIEYGERQLRWMDAELAAAT